MVCGWGSGGLYSCETCWWWWRWRCLWWWLIWFLVTQTFIVAEAALTVMRGLCYLVGSNNFRYKLLIFLYCKAEKGGGGEEREAGDSKAEGSVGERV